MYVVETVVSADISGMLSLWIIDCGHKLFYIAV